MENTLNLFRYFGEKISQINPRKNCLLVFCLILISSLFLWLSFSIADDDYWATKRARLSRDLVERNFDFNPAIHSTHPGALPLVVSLLPILNNFPPLQGIRVSSALIDTCATFLILLYVYRIFRNNLWWLVWASILLGSNYYLFTNPSDIVTAKLVGLAWIITYFHYIDRKNASWWDTLILGTSVGLAFSARIHMAVTLVFLIPLLIWHYSSLNRALLFLFTAVLTFFLTDPYLWHTPFSFLHASFTGVEYSIVNDIAPKGIRAYYYREVTVAKLPLTAPLAAASMLTLTALLTLKRSFFRTKIFLFALFLSVMISSGLILKSSINTMRYFYSIIFLLIIFLPIFTTEIINARPIKQLLIRNRMIPYYSLCILCILLMFSTIGLLINEAAAFFPPLFVYYIIVILFLLFDKKHIQTQ